MGFPYFFSIEGKYDAGPVTFAASDDIFGDVRSAVS
jgi:hypothetical protein